MNRALSFIGIVLVFIAHGQHPVVEDFDATFAELCDAFAAMGA